MVHAHAANLPIAARPAGVDVSALEATVIGSRTHTKSVNRRTTSRARKPVTRRIAGTHAAGQLVGNANVSVRQSTSGRACS